MSEGTTFHYLTDIEISALPILFIFDLPLLWILVSGSSFI